jgi:hypothetical protein
MKKQLINEIMGVPKVLDPWVRAFTEIMLDIVEEVSELGWEQRGEINYNDPDTGEEIEAEIFKTENISLSGKVFMEEIMKKMGFNDIQEFIKSQNFQELPIWRPTLNVSIVAVPSAILSKEESTIQASVSLDLDKGFSNLGKAKVVSEMVFNFNLVVELEGVSEKDITELEEAVSHELLHAYQKIKQLKGGGSSHFGRETALNALSNNPHFSEINIDWWSEFLNLVYLHLSFEINARINQLYYRLKRKNINNTEDFLRELHKSYLWEQMKKLENFNAEEFINKFEVPEEEMDFSNPLAMLHSLIHGSRFKSLGVDTSSKEEAIKSLIDLWDNILSVGVRAMGNMGANITMDNVPQKAKEDPYVFFKFFENRFHKKAETWKKKMYRIGALILQEKNDSTLQ